MKRARWIEDLFELGVVLALMGLVLVFCAQGATVTGTVTDRTGVVCATNVDFTAINRPLVSGSTVMTGWKVSTNSATNGVFWMRLTAGDYAVRFGNEPRDQFVIAVPSGNGTNTIDELATNLAGLTYVGGLSGVMTGATATNAGKKGLVPAPAAGDQTNFLRGDGTWAIVTNATGAAAAASDDTATPVYIRTAFPSAVWRMNELTIQYSGDGTNFTSIATNGSVWTNTLQPGVSNVCRDASIMWDGTNFYCAFTHAYQDYTPFFGLIQSSNLLNWTMCGTGLVRVSSQTNCFVWAPEWFRHNGSNFILINIGTEASMSNYIMQALDYTWQNWTALRLLANRVNDGYMVYDAGTYHLYVTDWNDITTALWTNSNLTSLFAAQKLSVTTEGEGPCVIPAPGGWRLYLDNQNGGTPNPPVGLAFSFGTTLDTFSNMTECAESPIETVGHGTVLGLTGEAKARLAAACWWARSNLALVGTVTAAAFVGDGSGLVNTPGGNTTALSNWTRLNFVSTVEGVGSNMQAHGRADVFDPALTVRGKEPLITPLLISGIYGQDDSLTVWQSTNLTDVLAAVDKNGVLHGDGSGLTNVATNVPNLWATNLYVETLIATQMTVGTLALTNNTAQTNLIRSASDYLYVSAGSVYMLLDDTNDVISFPYGIQLRGDGTGLTNLNAVAKASGYATNLNVTNLNVWPGVSPAQPFEAIVSHGGIKLTNDTTGSTIILTNGTMLVSNVYVGGSPQFMVATQGTPIFCISNNRVGIGKANPTVSLDVVGGIKTSGVVDCGSSLTASYNLSIGDNYYMGFGSRTLLLAPAQGFFIPGVSYEANGGNSNGATVMFLATTNTTTTRESITNTLVYSQGTRLKIGDPVSSPGTIIEQNASTYMTAATITNLLNVTAGKTNGMFVNTNGPILYIWSDGWTVYTKQIAP